ncbi:hypothetical protein [Actinomadura sp. 7K507]|uniref:hypothetical protein n=1 Tax=Actinomadura sp. 7K507 TaxID=2530365 RepID=UPI001046968A|nr:hypothetical protein [Actinomadura sp. 7K507]TDC97852.1 hypothetical protein E1285_02405 [Actinomadura sp. 7K507]
MIILSGVLVVVAIALLVAGIVAGNGESAEVFNLDALFVIYISIAVSIVSALCLAIGVFLRRKELFGPGVATTPARKSKAKKARKDKRGKAAPAAKAKGAPEAKTPADPADDEVEIPAPPADVPDDALVFVVRGRKRYHLDTCRQLAGRETEELTYAEAKEEGFSPCTACLPDTALAARAAASGPASPDAGKKAAGDVPAPAKPGAERSGGGLAGLAKPAPSTASAPTSFDKTAEIPRADEPAGPGAADKPEEKAEREPERPAPGPAGPTLTDMPVASLFTPPERTKAEEPAKRAEKTETAEPEPKVESAGERPAEAESAPPDVTTDPGPAPAAAPEADAAPDATAPKPRDAEDEDVPAPQSADEPEPAPEPAAESPAAEPGDGGPQVRILSGTKRYHRTDCALIEDIGDEADDLESLSRAEAKSRGCTPCLVCQPDREHARD